MRMYLSPERQLQKIWSNKSVGTFYPITQVPPAKLKLPNFAWFDDIRPKDKNDILVWRRQEARPAVEGDQAPCCAFAGTFQ